MPPDHRSTMMSPRRRGDAKNGTAAPVDDWKLHSVHSRTYFPHTYIVVGDKVPASPRPPVCIVHSTNPPLSNLFLGLLGPCSGDRDSMWAKASDGVGDPRAMDPGGGASDMDQGEARSTSSTRQQHGQSSLYSAGVLVIYWVPPWRVAGGVPSLSFNLPFRCFCLHLHLQNT